MERFVLALMCAFFGASSFAQSPSSFDEQRLARYTTVGGPTPAELDPLQSIVTVSFPRREVITVAHALDYLLLRSGFRRGTVDQPEVSEILALPLPEVHRRLGPYSVARALNVLMGEAFTLTVDPVRRRVSYALREVAMQVPTASSGSPSGLKPTTTPTLAAGSLLRGAPGLRALSKPDATGVDQVRMFQVNQQ